MRALATAPADRYTGAAGMASALRRAYSEAVVPATTSVAVWRLFIRSRLGAGLTALVLAVLGVTAWVLVQSESARQAPEQALPQIERLVEEREFVAAYRLGRRVERQLAANPQFQRVWHGFTAPATIRTTPPGAHVHLTDYRTPDGPWDLLGVSPIEGARLPLKSVRVRVEKAGYQELEGTQFRGLVPRVIEFTLDAEDDRPGRINVAGGAFPPGPRPPTLGGVPSAQPRLVGPVLGACEIGEGCDPSHAFGLRRSRPDLGMRGLTRDGAVGAGRFVSAAAHRER